MRDIPFESMTELEQFEYTFSPKEYAFIKAVLIRLDRLEKKIDRLEANASSKTPT